MLPAPQDHIYEHYLVFQGGKDSNNHLEEGYVRHEVLGIEEDNVIRTRQQGIFTSSLDQIEVYTAGDELEEVSAILFSYSREITPSTKLKMKEALFNKLDREMAKRNKVIQRLKDEHL